MNAYIDAWLSLEGGNAANTASALARLGRSTKLISKAGGHGSRDWLDRFPMGSPWVPHGFPMGFAGKPVLGIGTYLVAESISLDN